jgi:hypothetical protein
MDAYRQVLCLEGRDPDLYLRASAYQRFGSTTHNRKVKSSLKEFELMMTASTSWWVKQKKKQRRWMQHFLVKWQF